MQVYTWRDISFHCSSRATLTNGVCRSSSNGWQSRWNAPSPAATAESELYTLHPTPYALHPAPYTLHLTPCTLHPAPCALHPAPCTLHPAPYTLTPKNTPILSKLVQSASNIVCTFWKRHHHWILSKELKYSERGLTVWTRPGTRHPFVDNIALRKASEECAPVRIHSFFTRRPYSFIVCPHPFHFLYKHFLYKHVFVPSSSYRHFFALCVEAGTNQPC